MISDKQSAHRVKRIIRDAGGEVVGRTRLQKIVYLLELTEQGEGFNFGYRHFGPYSEDLVSAVQVADAFRLIEEIEKKAQWGGRYSIFKVNEELDEHEDLEDHPGEDRAQFVKEAASIGAVELELAATAAYLSNEGYEDPWGETKRRKPEKATEERLAEAREAYRTLWEIRTPRPLPEIV